MVPLSLGFVWLRNYLDNQAIRWTDYSATTLQESLQRGHTVIVFFHADWDVTSHVIDEIVFKAPAVRRAVRNGDVVSLSADCSQPTPDVQAALQSIDPRRPIPTVAIYYADEPDQPFVLQGIITEADLLDALQRAPRLLPPWPESR